MLNSLVALTWLISTMPGAPTTIAMFRATSIGVDASTVLAAEHLARVAIEARGIRVLGPDELSARIGPERAACSMVPCAGAGAAQVEVQEAVLLGLTRLGSKILVEARVVEAGSDRVAYAVSANSESVEDLDQVAARIVHAVIGREPFEEGATVESVTEAETLNPRRRGMNLAFGLRLGGGAVASGPFGGAGMYRLEPFFWQELGPRVVLEVVPLLSFTWGDKNVSGSSGPYGGTTRAQLLVYRLLGLSGLYFFSDADAAPFVGAGGAIDFVNAGYPGDDGNGATFGGTVRAGVALFRTYSAHAILEVRYDHEFAGSAPAVGIVSGNASVTFN